MPFIKQTVLQARRPPAEVGNIFTGRANEQHFFVEHVLTPEVPAYHVISVWGPAGVGKSTLLARLRDEACRPGFKDTCLTALVDERLFTPANLMDRCAAQLRLAGAPLAAFEQALARYKQAIQQREPEREAARAAFLREVAAQAGSNVMGEPLLGGLYEAVASEASASFWSGRRSFRPAGEAGRLDDPLGDLTRAFVDDLNWLTTTQAPFHPHGTARGRRVILFFDTFEPSAAETISWLLHHVLPATISDQVVLVVAGREPIQYALPNEQPVYTMPLAPFTEDETRTYLAERGMTAADRVAAIWHLSGGLPLYVSMLAYDQAGHVDETTDVVANIVRWMAEQDHSTQRLVLQAALFSRPFTQDDLAAFHALFEQERTDLYRWLIGLPFVQSSSLDGRHRYHDLAQKLLSRAFSQHAPQEFQTTHRALANHYRRQMERIQLAGGKEVYSSAEWLELALARVSQLFCLPDAASHASAIEQVMTICHEAQPQRTIAQMLRPLAQKQPPGHENAGARRIAQLLLHYLEANLASRKLLTAANGLLEAVRHAPVFSALVLARLYGKRGMAYCSRNKYQQAIADFDQALALDPAYAGAYLLRGIAHSACKEYQRAIADFDQALALDARATFAYVHRGIAYRKCKDYLQAIADFDRAVALDPQLGGVTLLRSLAYGELNTYRRGREDFDQAIKLDPTDVQAYVLRGMAYCCLNEESQAIADFDRALALDPSDALAYAGRGHVYLEMGEIERARADLLRSQAFTPHDVYVGLLLEWLSLCQQESIPDRPGLPERLETLAALDRQQPAALLCQGIALILRERFEEALAALDQALLLNPGMAEVSFWKSLTRALLGRDEEAKASLEQVLTAELPLPAVLLAPLRWLEQKRPDFYGQYVEPVLARAEGGQEQCA